MDLLRRLRSSKELSMSLRSKSKKEEPPVVQLSKSSDMGGEEDDDLNEVLQHDADQDDGEVFQDATAALGQQQQQKLKQEADDRQQQEAIRVRAPVSDEQEELEDDDDDDNEGGREGEDEVGEEDGRASHGSGESFDSALERMAASSETSYDTALSPRILSPVGSLQQDPAVIGNPPSDLSESQKDSLVRLNEMTSGNSSLDTSLIDNSSSGEEFKSRASELAESRGQSVDGSNFASAVDAVLPLVHEKSEKGIQLDDKSPEDEGEDARSVEAITGIDELSKQPSSPMPKAKLTAEDESDSEELQLSDGEDNAENVTLENGGEEKQAADGQGQPEIAERQSIGRSDSAAKPPMASSNSVPDSNGGHGDGSGNAAAMPMAKLSAEDEDVIEERDDDEEPEEGVEEAVEETAGETTEDENFPLKIRALPSDLDDNVSNLHADFGSTKLDTAENVNGDEDSLPAKVPSEAEEEVQTRPVAKVSDDDAPSPVNHPGEQFTNPDVPEIFSVALPTDQYGDTEGPEGPSEGVPTDDTEALGRVSEKPAGDEAVKGEDATKVPSIALPTDDSEDNGGHEVETFMSNLDDAKEIDGEDEEDEDHEEENEDDEDGYMERSEALAALLRGAESRAGAGAGDAPSLGSAGPSLPARPTRTVRSSLPSLEPASRAVQQPRSSEAVRSPNPAAETTNSEPDGNEETREKLQSIRVKFLRLALRLGQSAHNVVVAQVLYRLGLAEQLRGGRSNRPNTAFSFDRASSIAEEQERVGPEELDFACTIMMLGKTGVGKSATINSIFDEAKTGTNAFSPATNKVQVVTGHVHGIKVRVIDTPGLLPSVVDQRHNEKIMASVKGFIKKQSPDIVLYFDRLDMQSRDYGDLPLLRTITDTFGAAVWFNAIVVLTHASSAPPDGPNGLPLSYEMFVAQRSHVVQQTIRQAAGDMRLMNPVSLVENHRACRVNRSGDRVLPNGQVWKPQLLLLCFASKILAEANSLLKLQDNTPGRPFGQRSRAPPLPFLLSSLLQSRAPLKLPDEQVGDDDESDEDLEEEDDSEDEEDYDQLPPFRRLAKEEIAELDEVNRGQYFEELAERERLFQKKQWKEELKRRKEMKKRMAETQLDQSQFGEEGLEEDMARSAAVPVPMPDMVLPPSFDSDNPSHRYRYLETANQWLVRPVLETHGWDHDNGYDGMSVEKMSVIRDKIPISVSGQITKDKKEANLNMEAAASLKHGEGKVTMAGLDVQTVGKDLAYTLRSDTRFSNFKGNKTTGGLAVTLLGDTVSAGMKIEDRLLVGKRVKLVVNGGAITGGGDVAYGGSLEATLRDQEYPLSRTLSTLGVSIMDWHGDLAVGGNLQSQFILGKTMMVGRANINNRGAGQISIRASSSEQLQMALIGILPIVRAIVSRLFGQSQQ